MVNPPNVYGDPRISAKTVVGRPTFRFAVGDSVINGWYPAFCSQMPGLVGYGDIVSGHSITPTAPGSHVNGFWAYFYRATTGQAVIRGAHSIGATAINIYNLAGGLLPAGNGYPAPGMTLTIDTAGQQELGRIANSYGANGALITAGADSNSIPLAVASTKTHADGTIISWTRPSGERAYSMKTLFEVLFNGAPSPQDGSWLGGRLAEFDLFGNVNDYGDPIEANYLHDAISINSGAVDIIMFYLALPVNTGAPNLRLHCRSAEVTPVETTGDFSIFAATPTIKAMTVAMPAPAAYDNTRAIRCSVNSPLAGTFTAGQVFVCLGFIAVKHGATSGVILDAAAEAGMQVQDLANDAASFGNIWSAAYQAQYAAAVRTTQLGNIDVYTVHLGTNNCPSPTASLVTMLTTIDNNMAAAEPTAGLEYATPYNTNTNSASGASGRMAAACPLLGALATNCAYDMITECGNPAYVTVRLLSDGTHPNTQGKEWFAAKYQAMIKACQSVVGNSRPTIGRGVKNS